MSEKSFQVGDYVEVYYRDMSGYVLEVDGNRYLVRIHALDINWYSARDLVFLAREKPAAPTPSPALEGDR